MKLTRHHSVLVSLVLTSVWTLTACDSSEPTPTPASKTAEAAERKSGDLEETVDPDDEEDEEGEEDEAADKIFDYGGADVGDEDSKKAVKECHDKGMFFDRFSGEVGTCTDYAAALLDCTIKGVQRLLSSKQRKQFKEALAGSYKGSTLDQCFDCEKGKGPLCQTSSGAEQVGTKLAFVREDGTALKGMYLLIPLRPGQKSKNKD